MKLPRNARDITSHRNKTGKSIVRQVAASVAILVIAFTGVSLVTPGHKGPLAAPKASAAGCTYNHYWAVWAAVAVRENPDRTSQIRAVYHPSDYVVGPNSSAVPFPIKRIGTDGASYTYLYPGGWAPSDGVLYAECW